MMLEVVLSTFWDRFTEKLLTYARSDTQPLGERGAFLLGRLNKSVSLKPDFCKEGLSLHQRYSH